MRGVRGSAPSWEDVSELIAARLPQWRGYRQRLGLGHLGRPVWVDDESFDLANHVHHSTVSPPGHEDELSDLMGRLMSVELDRRRPLWEVWVVDGLAGQRWALICKIHHCLLDGIAGAELLARLLDVERHPHPTSLRPAGPTGPETGGGRTASGRRHPIRNGAERAKAAGARFGHPRGVASAVRDTVTGAFDLGRELRPRATLSIHGTIGKQRRWAVARSTLDDLAAVQAVFGGTVNDVALAVLAGAFRDLLIARGDRVDGVALRSLVPVSLRNAATHGFIRSGDAVEPAQWPLERFTTAPRDQHPRRVGGGNVRAGDLEPHGVRRWRRARSGADGARVPRSTTAPALVRIGAGPSDARPAPTFAARCPSGDGPAPPPGSSSPCPLPARSQRGAVSSCPLGSSPPWSRRNGG